MAGTGSWVPEDTIEHPCPTCPAQANHDCRRLFDGKPAPRFHEARINAARTAHGLHPSHKEIRVICGHCTAVVTGTLYPNGHCSLAFHVSLRHAGYCMNLGGVLQSDGSVLARYLSEEKEDACNVGQDVTLHGEKGEPCVLAGIPTPCGCPEGGLPGRRQGGEAAERVVPRPQEVALPPPLPSPPLLGDTSTEVPCGS